MSKPEYWTWWEGTYGNPCSRHRTLPGAIKAAKECQMKGGTPHKIFKVEEVGRVSVFRRGKKSMVMLTVPETAAVQSLKKKIKAAKAKKKVRR